ncbi:MAG: ribosome maturation factor RimP [Candidatus Omnitrophica bacterium]|nr:ribosome maturation factor RimP [Candidatus Omnitrophota bacterium]
MDDTQREAVRQLAEPILAGASAELVELNLHRHGGGTLVRLLVDKVGGVTIQDCARLNQLLSQALDEADVIGERYTLEVSSPGLDRPLVSRRDFERAIGEDLDLQLSQPLGSSHQVTGQLLAVQPEAVVISTIAGNVTVPMGSIQRAKKTVKW